MTRVMRALALVVGMSAGGLPIGEATAQQAQQPQQAGQPQAAQPTKPKPPKAAKAKAKPQPAAEDGEKPAFDAEAALDKAGKALAEGKPQVASGLADQVLTQANKTPRTTARALAVRGQARLRQGKPAEAIADFDSSLWVMDGLGPSEREAATAARAEAFRQAGVATQAPRTNETVAQRAAPAPAPAATPAPSAPLARVAAAPATATPAPVTPPAPARQRSAGDAWRAEPTPAPPAAAAAAPRAATTAAAPPQAAGGGIGGFFSSLFGASKSGAETTGSVPPVPPKVASVSSAEPQRATPEPKAPTSARAQAAPRAAVATAPAGAGVVRQVEPTDGFQVQLAAVRTREAAKAMADKVRKDNPAALGARTFEIDEPVFGNMGKFYRVRIGSFATVQDSLAICSALRNQGVDCMVLGQ